MKGPVEQHRTVELELSLHNFRRLDHVITGSIRAYKNDHGEGPIITASLAKRLRMALWAAVKDGQFD